jgi:signal transduction histidine kinase
MEKGEQLLSLISGMLEISRIEAGSLELERHPVELAALVAHAAHALEAQAERRGIQLELSTRESRLAPLTLDGDKIRQAISNVIGNAIKFTPEGGQVHVRVRAGAGGWTNVVVSDTGIGIAESALPYVFDAFYQADSSPTREYGGVGLGLAIARSYVQAHGGTIRIESAVGRGTTVTIALPATDGPPAEAP